MIITTTKGKPAQTSRARLTQPPQNRVKREVWRLLWLALATQLAVALLSFSPQDPSWTTWSSTARFHNWMGRAGSIEADILFQLLGIASYALVGVFLLIAFRRPAPAKGGKEAPNSPWMVPVLFLLSLCAFVQAAFPVKWVPFGLSEPGGIFGYLMHRGLSYAAGELGALWLSLLVLLCASILLLNWPVVSWSLRHLRRAVLWSWEWASRCGLAAWTRVKTLREKPRSAPPAPLRTAPLALPERCTPPKGLDDGIIEAEVTSSSPSPDDRRLFDLISFSAPKKTKKPPVAVRKPAYDPNQEFELPPVDLLKRRAEGKDTGFDREWFVEKSRILVEKLNDFGVEGEIVNISPGPVITVYEFKPASGVKIKEIANLSDDLTLALSVLSVRIVAPIPGKPVVGIEIPSPKRETVLFRELMEETPFYDSKIKIPILMGRLASGEPVVADLSSMPHLLVAGATGTGKSVFINSLITSLLFRFTPAELKLIMVDPKMVELSHYEGIPHLLLPVVVDSKKAAQALRWAVAEMERRYSLLHKAGVRHIDSYNEQLREMSAEEIERRDESEREPLPYIVVLIDEYADLMAVVPKEVEHSITRLAQKARASGIHLVLATQRPSTDVVTGLIKANFPSRLSFRVASAVDSKTILDRTGAERLLGNGDLLLHSAGFTMLKRMQGAFISDKETAKVVDFLKSQGEPQYDEGILAEVESVGSTGGEGEGEEDGELFDQAVRLVTERGEASISLIQRGLRIGYNRAANLMDALEREGVVAPASGSSKRRQVLVNSI